MNDSILRGLCKFCSCLVAYPYNKAEATWYHNRNPYKNHKVEPVWFLSSNQIGIITAPNSRIFHDWRDKEHPIVELNVLRKLVHFLNEKPFLVAQILKESEKE